MVKNCANVIDVGSLKPSAAVMRSLIVFALIDGRR